jgi:hypothetical protein
MYLLVQTSSDQLLFKMKLYFLKFTKQAILMGWSTVLTPSIMGPWFVPDKLLRPSWPGLEKLVRVKRSLSMTHRPSKIECKLLKPSLTFVRKA